jgi:uncharacterized protein
LILLRLNSVCSAPQPPSLTLLLKGGGETFLDPRRVIAEDLEHSSAERRYFCFGMVGGGVMTVRFTYRGGRIRIFGAGYWRKGKRIYEQQNC